MIIHDQIVNNVGTIVFSSKPMKRVINYFDHDCLYSYFLSFPYLIFKLNYRYNNDNDNRFTSFYSSYWSPTSFKVAFATELKPKKLYFPALSNIDCDFNNKTFCSICMEYDIATESSEDLIKKFIHEFWHQSFNNDLNICQTFYRNDLRFCGTRGRPTEKEMIQKKIYIDYRMLGTYGSWHEYTKENPTWIPNENNMIEMCDYDSFLNILPVNL